MESSLSNPVKPPQPTCHKREPDGHWRVSGVYVGRKLSAHLFAEPVASRRFVIRSTQSDPTFAKRMGEVFGGDGDFQACTMRGDHVALARTLLEGAKSLEHIAV